MLTLRDIFKQCRSKYINTKESNYCIFRFFDEIFDEIDNDLSISEK